MVPECHRRKIEKKSEYASAWHESFCINHAIALAWESIHLCHYIFTLFICRARRLASVFFSRFNHEYNLMCVHYSWHFMSISEATKKFIPKKAVPNYEWYTLWMRCILSCTLFGNFSVDVLSFFSLLYRIQFNLGFHEMYTDPWINVNSFQFEFIYT